MNCPFCNNLLEEQQLKITLLCGHTYHTRCFLVHSVRDHLNDFVCTVCNEQIITHDIYEEANPPPSTTECETLSDSSEEFRNGITTILEKYKKYNKMRALLTKKVVPIIREFKSYIKPQISILKNYIKSKKTHIKELEEYKNTRKELGTYKRYVTSFCNKHNITEYELRRYLRKTRILIIRSARFYRLEYLLSRSFRIRI